MSDELKNEGLDYLDKKADLTFSFATALNAIIRKFQNRPQIYVSEVHQALKDLGVSDYDPASFKYIEDELKTKYHILVVPDL